MTLIQVINPNTARAMTEAIGHAARAVAGPGTTITAVSPDMGPESIESHYDAALAVPGVLGLVAAGERAGADGYVIACFGDPGLDAARELAAGPVAGIAEAAMHAASFLGRTFSVVTTLSRTAGRTWDLVRRYGFGDACRNVHACDLPVLALDSAEARAVIAKRCALARDADGCDVIVLGCAGMTGLAAELTGDLGIPVVDGVAAATKTVEALVALGLRTSPRDEFAPPPAKPYSGLLSGFGLRADAPGPRLDQA
ncbi:MAG TPA: aspartate/glutamate racemase family protein [Streptosporangiaceae bacterium]|nr:aspartate/glutamate racemase family protein [Streptosporangiaceae bacterium]